MKTTKANWKDEVISLLAGRKRVEQALTLAELLAKVAMAHRTLSLADWKAGMVELHESGRIVMDDYTRALADVIDEPAMIEHQAGNGYGYKWYVRGVN